MDGMPVFSPNTGIASTSSTMRAGSPNRTGLLQSFRPHRSKRLDRWSPECAHLSVPLSTRGPSLASTAGSRVRVASRMKTTEIMMPSAIERNAGLGTIMTADSEMSTVNPENSTALPAVSMVSATASTGLRPDPNSDPRKRTTMNSA